jgi:LysM repeat protein
LGRVFVFLLLLHVFLIGAIVLYNIVSERPGPSIAEKQKAGAPVVGDPAGDLLKRSELSEYQVRSGDSLKSISDATGATTEEIIRLNQLDQTGGLYVGRRLQLPLRTTPAEGGSPQSPAPAAVAVPVQESKSPDKIAAAQAVAAQASKGSPEAFAAAEPRAAQSAPAPKLIKAQPVAAADTPPAATRTVPKADALPAGRGETAVATKSVPAATPVKPAPPAAKPAATAAEGRSYQVKPGDTFYGIARKHGVSADAIMKANGFTDPGKLRQGTLLKIPAKK